MRPPSGTAPPGAFLLYRHLSAEFPRWKRKKSCYAAYADFAPRDDKGPLE